jgi:cell division septum initiation protein DivIVA
VDSAQIAILVSVLAAPLAAFVTWFFNRKKYVADIYSSISESSQNAVETMQATMNTLHAELVEVQIKAGQNAQRIIELQTIANDYLAGRQELDAENVKLKSRVYELTATLQALVREVMPNGILEKWRQQNDSR